MKVGFRWMSASVLLVAGLGSQALSSRTGQSDLQEQLRLARSEGIPTTPDEFAAMVPHPDGPDNAAPFYEALRTQRAMDRWREDVDPVFDRTAMARAKLKAALRRVESLLRIADLAASQRHCSFDHNWNDGIALLTFVHVDPTTGANMILARGSLAAAEHRPADAIADARKAQRMARHFSDDATYQGALTGRTLHFMVASRLAAWLYAFPRETAYLRELRSVLAEIPKPDLRRERRFALVEALSAIDLCRTPEGREKLGVRPGAWRGADKADLSESDAELVKTVVVRGFRKYWAALGAAGRGRDKSAARAEFRLGLALFPLAGEIYGYLGTPLDDDREVALFKARQLVFTAFLRGHRRRGFARSIRSSDLISPLDGRPVDYRFDGKRLFITAGQGAGRKWTTELSFPPSRK